MRLKPGWTPDIIVREFVEGRSQMELAHVAVERPYKSLDETTFALLEIEAILRAALREQGK